jgi:hypothetical protein
MGTNYYFRNKKLHEAAVEARKAEKALQTALGGHDQYESMPEYHTEDPEGLHIGKSSAGWLFNLCVYPDMGIKELSDWKKAWVDPNYEIVDEYGRVQTPEEMLDEIVNRHGTVTKGQLERELKSGGLTLEGCDLNEKYRLLYNTWDDYQLGKEGSYTITAHHTNFS